LGFVLLKIKSIWRGGTAKFKAQRLGRGSLLCYVQKAELDSLTKDQATHTQNDQNEECLLLKTFTETERNEI
jgi:hypothetical protein